MHHINIIHIRPFGVEWKDNKTWTLHLEVAREGHAIIPNPKRIKSKALIRQLKKSLQKLPTLARRNTIHMSSHFPRGHQCSPRSRKR
uniref:Uncharacterized protein n=1 Tax=Lactuca sativa TaxID=4236 RepID=A0A9R1X5B8_LACSA|nr:hypothetical protein LSAT_V11C600300870 [Lactuca sativa]